MAGATEKQLMDVLGRAGKPLELQVHPNGSRLLLLPYGARVLGLFAPGSSENLMWTHPALSSDVSARAFFQSSDWHNTGGDRTWLGPELDIFFPNYPDTKLWQVPTALDPACFTVARGGSDLTLTSNVSVPLLRTHGQVEARLTKRWSPAPNPLRHEPDGQQMNGVAYAGYTQTTELELLAGSSKSARVGLWDLLGAPPGGEVLIPTHTRTTPEIYTGTIPSADLHVTDHLVRFQTPGTGIRKIGIRACASSGRIGYIWPSGGASALIVCNFAVDPSGEYIDVPWMRSEASDAFGFSTQACAVKAGEWDYVELEHHAPAISLGGGESRSVDTSQFWAFSGPYDVIRKIARVLLSSEV
jgi:hypothetical protein